jgi:hypothetical protein
MFSNLATSMENKVFLLLHSGQILFCIFIFLAVLGFELPKWLVYPLDHVPSPFFLFYFVLGSPSFCWGQS